MGRLEFVSFLLLVWLSAVFAKPLNTLEKDSALIPYQPYVAGCPSISSVRKADSLNPNEAAYIKTRKANADAALLKWLQKVGFNSSRLQSSQIPTVALALGGGGPKAALVSAGVVQAFDGRDSSAGTAGLLQGLTYLSALSGGSLTLANIIGNDFQTVTKTRILYNQTFPNLIQKPLLNIVEIVADLAAKLAVGAPTTLIDFYGRALGYDFIGGPEGAAGVTVSGIAKSQSFSKALMPYPIIQSTAANFAEGQCYPAKKSPLFEFSPYEFGSWDTGVASFIPTNIMGTTFGNGAPVVNKVCEEGFDNLGWAIGTSANILVSPNTSCPFSVGGNMSSASSWLPPAAVEALQDVNLAMSLYGILPNPFKGFQSASKVANDDKLYLVDGGVTGVEIPYWSFLQPERNVDVIIAADFSSSGAHNTTDGSTLASTYSMAQAYGIKKMPKVPTAAQIAAEGLATRAQFFGCNETGTTMLIYLPDSYATQTDGSTFFFSQEEIDFLVAAGQNQTSQGDDASWPFCLACGITTKKSESVAQGCGPCLQKYCWKGA